MAVRRLLAFLGVSIHALLAECDPLKALTCADRKVSIHALLAECDPNRRGRLDDSHRFQSTHSLRSATSGREM